MRKTESKEIGGMTFVAAQMQPSRAMRMSFRLSKSLLPALAKAAKGLDGIDLSKGLNAKVDLRSMLDHVGDGLDTLFTNMPEAEFEKLWRELFETVQVTHPDTGQTAALLPVLDALPLTPKTLLQVLAFALEVNFHDFFPGLAVRFPGLAASLSGSKA